MKSHIAGSSLTSKASIEDAIKHGEMQELFALYRICIAIAANEAFGFGNDLDDYPHPYCPNCGAKMDKKDGQRR